MEREANYAIVGAISILLLIGAFVFVVWLANFRFNQTYDNYRVIFLGPVSGLTKGGEVQFNGIRVGEITRLALDPLDPNRVLTDLQVEQGTPVRADSTAQAVAQGITGVKYVQISAGSPGRPLLRDISRERPPVIMARRGRMEDLVKDLSKVTSGGAEAVARINRMLSDGNLLSISRSLDDVQAVTSEFRTRRSAMFASMDSALGKLDNAATDLQATLASARGSLTSKDKGALDQLASASTELRGAATDLHRLIIKMDGPVSELSTSTIPGVTAALGSVQQAADRLDSVAYEIGNNPHAVLTNRGGKEVDIPQ